MRYTYEDCKKLGKIIEKYDDTTIKINWTSSITEWQKRRTEEIIKLIIKTFLISYQSNLNYQIIHRAIYTKSNLKNISTISLKNAQNILGIFLEWHQLINK